MSSFKSNLLPKSVGAVGQSLHYAFKKAAMASVGRRKAANENDPWKISAIVSALMELFLSVLLLLGAAIAFITSQLVNYFDLEPPCTYIGCSHTLLPKSRKRRRIDHGKEDFCFELCPDCHASWGYTKRYNEKSLRIEDDTEISSLPEGDDFGSNKSSSSTSDVDTPHLDEDTSVFSDLHLVKKVSSISSIQNCKKILKLKHVKSEASNGAGNASQFFNENCVPLFPTRSVSACSSKSNVENYCEMLATSMDKWRMPNSCHDFLLQKETSTDDDASLHSGNDKHHYMLLEDEDEAVNQNPFFDSFEAVTDCENVHGYLLLEDDDENISEAGQLHAESAQPSLPCLVKAISAGENLSSASLITNKSGNVNVVLGSYGRAMIIESAEASNVCKVSEGCKEPTCTINACEGEHRHTLREGDDEDTCEAPFLKDLHLESAQPLLNGVSDDESEVPIFLNMAPNMEVLIDGHQSSGIGQLSEDCPYHELTEVGIQKTVLEEQQHEYILLGNDDEDSSEAPDFESVLSECAQPLLQEGVQVESVLSECAQPLLQGVQGGESEAPRLSLNFACAKPAAKVGVDHGADIKQWAEDCAYCELPRESTSLKGSIQLDQTQATEALLQGFLPDHVNTYTRGSGCLGPPSCDTAMVEDHVESDNHLKMEDLNVLLADLEIVHCLRESKKNNAEESLLDMESGCTAFGDLLEVDRFEQIKSSVCVSQIVVTGEALLTRIFGTELHKQESCSEENSTLTGLYISDLEKLWDNNDKVVDQSELYGKDLASNLCTSNATMLQDVCLFQTQGQLDELEFSPLVCLTKNDGNKTSVAADCCSIENDNANEIEDTGTTKITSEASFETVIEGAVGEPDMGFESFRIKDELNTAVIMHDQQVIVKNHEKVLDVVSQIAQQDKEEILVDKDQEEDALTVALCAERKMLVALETELENERNAAAIATSEAMAMISRLQEEKSAMQLEVAQLQRMAEEKAEYDEQAMALLKEILFKRETEKHALEKEVELYRERLSAEKVKRIEDKGSSMWSSTPLLSLSRMDEDKGPFSPEGGNIRLQNLPSLDEFYKSENAPLPCPSKGQNMTHEESTEQSAQFAKSSEARSLKGLYVNDQVDTSMEGDKRGSASPLIERLGMSRSIFSTNDEETQFILERLWVLEEELRELRGVDGLGGQKKSFEVQYLDCSPVSKKSAGNVINLCHGREAGGHADENGIGVCLPVHDVYEVHSTPSQKGRDNKGGNFEVPDDWKSSPRNIMHEEQPAATMRCNSSQVVTHTGRLFPSNESQCDRAIIANQVEPYADKAYAQFLKTTEGGLVSTDVIQQLAVRLQVLETDRELLREILESFRHKDAELKLLQEIAQQLRELRMVGFSSISTVVALQDPMSATFGKSCTRALKKRRYCNEPGQADVILLHQRSI